MDEFTGELGATPEAKDVFSVEVARAWERALEEAPTPQTRKVALRTGMVLGHGRNSVFPVLRRLVKFGLGGRMASGNQYVSWIHEEDFCRAIEWLIARGDLSGPINLTAPNPVPNRELMRTLRAVCGAPFGLPATRWMLETAIPEPVAKMTVQPCQPGLECDLVLSGLPSSIAEETELQLAKSGMPVE